MDKREKTISEEIIYAGRVFTVKKRQVLTPGGRERNRELIFHPGGSCILAVNRENEVYLIRQYRAPFDREVLEAPAGKLEKGESPLGRAVRELREETGFGAENFCSLGQFWPTVGYSDEIIYLYLATGLKPGDTHFDPDEYIDLVKMPFDKAYRMCAEGEITDGKTLAAFLRAKEKLGL